MRRLPRPHLLRRLLLAAAVAAVALPPVAVAPAAPALAAAGTAHYVSCRPGAASGDGSRQHPWTSVWSIRDHGPFSPGDSVLLRRGTTCEGRIVPLGSGTPEARIVLGQYGSGKAKPVVAAGGSQDGTAAIQMDDLSWWTVQDIHVTNTDGDRNTRVKRAGVLLRNTTPSRLSGMTVRRMLVDRVDSTPSASDDSRAYGGIAVLTVNAGKGFSDTLIEDNVVRGVGRTGIVQYNLSHPQTRDNGTRITGNRVERARGDSIIVGYVNDARIDHNVSANGSNMAPCPERLCGRMGGVSTASAGIWPISSNGVRIDHNEVYGQHADAGDGAAIDVDLYAKHVVVEQNYLHDNEGGGVMFCGAQRTTVRFNVLETNRKAAFVFTCGWRKDQRVKDITITNNTVFGTGASTGAWVVKHIWTNPGSGIRFTNNVVHCSGACRYSWPSAPTAASNTYVGTRSRTEPVGPGTRRGASPLKRAGSGTTGFASLRGYRPRSASAIGTGVRISGTRLTDLFDRAVDARRPIRGAAR